VIQVVNLQPQPEAVKAPGHQRANGSPALPDGCNVYEGLSDEVIADMDEDNPAARRFEPTL
jgi:hypothetical protein